MSTRKVQYRSPSKLGRTPRCNDSVAKKSTNMTGEEVSLMLEKGDEGEEDSEIEGSDEEEVLIDAISQRKSNTVRAEGFRKLLRKETASPRSERSNEGESVVVGSPRKGRGRVESKKGNFVVATCRRGSSRKVDLEKEEGGHGLVGSSPQKKRGRPLVEQTKGKCESSVTSPLKEKRGRPKKVNLERQANDVCSPQKRRGRSSKRDVEQQKSVVMSSVAKTRGRLMKMEVGEESEEDDLVTVKSEKKVGRPRKVSLDQDLSIFDLTDGEESVVSTPKRKNTPKTKSGAGGQDPVATTPRKSQRRNEEPALTTARKRISEDPVFTTSKKRSGAGGQDPVATTPRKSQRWNEEPDPVTTTPRKKRRGNEEPDPVTTTPRKKRRGNEEPAPSTCKTTSKTRSGARAKDQVTTTLTKTRRGPTLRKRISKGPAFTTSGVRKQRKRAKEEDLYEDSSHEEESVSEWSEEEEEEAELSTTSRKRRRGRRKISSKMDSDSDDSGGTSEGSVEEGTLVPSPQKKTRGRRKEVTLTIPDREMVPVEVIRRGKGARGKQSKFEVVRQRLHVSAAPDSLPCRGDEFDTIFNFVEGNLVDATGGCMYISGVPGTGKTATVREVTAVLRTEAEEGSLPPFKFVDINGMRLTEPRQAYVSILEQLTGERASPDHACSQLDSHFTSSKKKSPTLLFVDELDLLMTRQQKVLYNLLEWPSRHNSCLVVLAVANTMDLPERILQNKLSSRTGLTRMTFEPYTHQQLQEIVEARVSGTNVFEPDVLELAVRKVAAGSGDVRRALELLLRATEITQSEGKSSSVGMAHLQKAVETMFSSSKIKAVKYAPLYQKFFLRAVLAQFKSSGVEEAVYWKVYEHVKDLCAIEGVQPLNHTVVNQLCNSLAACRILLVKGEDIHRKIRLNMTQDEVLLGLS